MPYIGCCGRAPQLSGAGQVATGAVTGAAAGSTLGPVGTVIGTVVGTVSGLFGGGGGIEAGVQQQVQQWYQAALGGDIYAEAMLRCMSKMGRSQDEALLRAHPPQPPMSGSLPWSPADCFTHGWAHVSSQQYGASMVRTLDAQRLAGQVGTVLVGQSDIPARAQALLSNPLVLGAVALGVFFLVRGRR